MGDKVFNPLEDYVATKSFRGQGKVYAPGKPFDKSCVDSRRLKLLVDSRYIMSRGEYKLLRARDENGHFVADDPDTPDINEAYFSGKFTGKDEQETLEEVKSEDLEPQIEKEEHRELEEVELTPAQKAAITRAKNKAAKEAVKDK